MQKEVMVPDIGSFSQVPIIEISVKEGDEIALETSLIVLETDKATMEIPAPFAGKVAKLKVSVGDRVSQGDVILMMSIEPQQSASIVSEQIVSTISSSAVQPLIHAENTDNIAKTTPVEISTEKDLIYASPGVRRFAREMGIDLQETQGSGRKGRVLREDIKKQVKHIVENKNNINSKDFSGTKPIKVDFAKFGTIEYEPLSRIQKLSGAHLHRNWVSIPHVTQFDEADITAMEEFRKESQNNAVQKGLKLTPVVFLLKAIASALQAYPRFNASLDETEQQLIIKKYYNIGVAVDTPQGLVVPVVKEVDKKSLLQLAKEIGDLSVKARAGQLMAQDMQGGCFTLSSLGGVGGTAFTPIINAPEVAILGISKAQIKPIYQKTNDLTGQFVPRLMLPLSLSYDHRVIDGAEAARFLNVIGQYLTDIRQLLL